ncbi:hypothetical protein, partial [Corallococcus sp. CA041A]
MTRDPTHPPPPGGTLPAAPGDDARGEASFEAAADTASGSAHEVFSMSSPLDLSGPEERGERT